MKISSFSSFLFVAVILTAAYSVKGSEEEDQHFKDFLQVSLANYSSWLKSNKLDPTPLMTIPANMTYEGILYNTSGEIRNQVIHNHSNIGIWSVLAYMDDMTFSVTLDFPEIKVNGEYDIKGWLGSTEITGSGKANLTSEQSFGVDPYLVLIFENFKVTPEGFVNLSDAEQSIEFESGFHGDFENLWAGNSTDFMRMILADHIFKFQILEWWPLGQYLESFLQEVFANTSYSDIIQGRGIP